MSTESMQKQLELIDKKLSEINDTANRHLSQFLFGGLIAVIALLNTDLIIMRDFEIGWHKLVASIVVGCVALVLASHYFRMVIRHHNELRRSHRRLKFKYELTLHADLCDAPPSEYRRHLETGLPPTTTGPELAFPESNQFADIAAYLKDHHARRLMAIDDKPHLYYMAMDIVWLTLVVKILSIATAYFLKAYF